MRLVLAILLTFVSSQASAQRWQALNGPYDSMNWLQIGQKPGELYLFHERLLATDDDGKTWRIVTLDGVPIHPTVSAAVVDSSGSLLVVESNQSGSLTKLIRVTDGGRTAVLLDTNNAQMSVFPTVVLPNGTIIAMGNTLAISWRSRDHGQTWQEIPGTLNRLVSDRAGRLYTYRMGDPVIKVSTDEGDSWMSISTNFPNISQLSPVGEKLFIKNWYYAFVSSTDLGATWSAPQPIPSAYSTFFLAPNPSEIFIANTTVGFYMSSDRGESWFEMNNGLPHGQFSSLMAKGDRIYAIGAAGTVGTPYKLELNTSSVQLPATSARYRREDNLLIYQASAGSSIELVNPLGQTVRSDVSIEGEIRIDTRGITPGAYFIRTQTGIEKVWID